MKNVSKNILVFIITGFFIGSGLISGFANPCKNQMMKSDTLIVDDDGDAMFTEIWDAINHSHNGDTIYVCCGTYREHIVIDKSIQLVGESRDCVRIDGEFEDKPLITITADSVKVKDITVRNGEEGINILSNHNEITNVKIKDTKDIRFNDADDNLFSENILDTCPLLISGTSSGNYICDNTLNERLIIEENANENVILNNELNAYVTECIELRGSMNSINGNYIHNMKPSGRGIYICQDASNNLVFENIIEQCDWGIYVYDFAVGNTIYHNNFISNRYQAFDKNSESLNNWDNGQEGNYWSDYEVKYPNAKDKDENGIWDNPYFISNENMDNYPFVENNGWKPALVSDLECDGRLSWSKIEPNSIQTGSFKVKNVGDSGSLLNWEIDEKPSWGEWTFTPESGSGLMPSEGEVIVSVAVVAPDVMDTSFSGEILVMNEDNSSDFEKISVSLTTPKNKEIDHVLLDFLRNGKKEYPEIFSFLRTILGLNGERNV